MSKCPYLFECWEGGEGGVSDRAEVEGLTEVAAPTDVDGPVEVEGPASPYSV